MKDFYKYGLTGLSALAISAGALAAVHYDNYSGQDGDSYVTLYSQGVQYAKVNVTDNSRRNALFSWKTNYGSGNDFAAGVGWEHTSWPNNLYYSIDSWKPYANGDGAVFGAYGWSCNNVNELNVELYITEAWFQDGQFVPGNTEKKGSVDGNDGTYDIYVGPELNRAQRCTNGRNFQQVWAVRRGKRSVQTSNVTLSFSTIVSKMSQYAYIRNLDYLVMGLDGFPGSSADITIREVQRD